MKLPWYLRQKPSIALVAGLGGLFTVVGGAMAQPWGATSPRLWWGAVATSVDGRTIVAAAYRQSYFDPTPAPIFVSTNAGGSWTQTSAPTNGWSSVTCSADGLKLLAVRGFGWFDAPNSGRGSIYTSPDAGTTWAAATAPTNNWTSVASSADGARLVAAVAPYWEPASSNYVDQGAIYCSSDAGATWTQTPAPSNAWHSVARSADGLRLVASAEFSSGEPGDGLIYTSLDAGVTWTPARAPTNNWTCVASSADGAKLAAVAAPFWAPASTNYVSQGAIFCSSDAGTTWTQTTAPNTNYWSGVASSADRTKLLAASQDVGIYRSSDAGATWTAMSAFSYEGGGLGAVACSADGCRLVAGGYSSMIYTWPYAGPWRLVSTPRNDWQSLACSTDASKLVAVDSGSSSGSIYTSGDLGITWTRTSAPVNFWSRITSSADGTKLVATASLYPGGYPSGDGGIYRSPDSGTNWILTSLLGNNWASVTSSANGSNLVAVAPPLWSGGYYLDGSEIYRSSDGGTTWVQTIAPSNVWHSVASSADGTKLVAGGEPAVYRSEDAGATWIPTGLPSGNWNSVASSADGTKLVAVTGTLWDPVASNYTGGAIYHSSDAGVTWTRTTAPTGEWLAVACSADGTTLCALRDDLELLEISTNSGAIWAPANVPAGQWNSVAVSADGSFLGVAGVGQIATLHPPASPPPIPPSPQLVIDRLGGNVGLSWLVPSTPFVLEQTADLRSTDWVAVPTSPTLNVTNLNYQLTLPAASGARLYRLTQQ